MRQQVVDGDRPRLAVRPLGMEPGQVVDCEVVEAELALVDHRERRGATKGLVTEAKRKIVSSRVRFSASRSA